MGKRRAHLEPSNETMALKRVVKELLATLVGDEEKLRSSGRSPMGTRRAQSSTCSCSCWRFCLVSDSLNYKRSE